MSRTSLYNPADTISYECAGGGSWSASRLNHSLNFGRVWWNYSRSTVSLSPRPQSILPRVLRAIQANPSSVDCCLTKRYGFSYSQPPVLSNTLAKTPFYSSNHLNSPSLNWALREMRTTSPAKLSLRRAHGACAEFLYLTAQNHEVGLTQHLPTLQHPRLYR